MRLLRGLRCTIKIKANKLALLITVSVWGASMPPMALADDVAGMIAVIESGKPAGLGFAMSGTPAPVNQFRVALAYQEGKITPKNLGKAIHFYELAAKGGVAEAMNNLGLMYLQGEGVPVSQKKAFELFSAAAEKGIPQACVNLATMYANGNTVVRKDTGKAKKLLVKAKQAGHKDAGRMLQQMEQYEKTLKSAEAGAKRWAATAKKQASPFEAAISAPPAQGNTLDIFGVSAAPKNEGE